MEYRIQETEEKIYIKPITPYDWQEYYYAVFFKKYGGNAFHIYRQNKKQNIARLGEEKTIEKLEELNDKLEPIPAIW